MPRFGRRTELSMKAFKVHDAADLHSVPTKHDAEAEDIIAASEDALALSFAKRHAADLQYVAVWDRWFCWDGRRWVFDSTLDVFDRVRRICREAASEANEPRVQTALASAKTVAAARLRPTNGTPIRGCSTRRAAWSIFVPERCGRRGTPIT
jgi:phage/plasmid-associated DNA primase